MTGERCRAVFLDRDGVLNRVVVKNGRPYPPASPADLEILPDAPGALDALKAAGFLLIGITNQPDVARGTQRREVVEAINAALMKTLPLEAILVCAHDDADGCGCRKPLPGLLHQAAAAYAIELPESVMVGDRWKDVETGRRAGCETVLIEYGYAEPWPGSAPDCTVRSLAEAAAWILRRPAPAIRVR